MCSKKTKAIYVKAFNTMTNKCEAKAMAEPVSCECKCKFSSITCVVCQCECKNYRTRKEN